MSFAEVSMSAAWMLNCNSLNCSILYSSIFDGGVLVISVLVGRGHSCCGDLDIRGSGVFNCSSLNDSVLDGWIFGGDGVLKAGF